MKRLILLAGVGLLACSSEAWARGRTTVVSVPGVTVVNQRSGLLGLRNQTTVVATPVFQQRIVAQPVFVQPTFVAPTFVPAFSGFQSFSSFGTFNSFGPCR